MKDSLRKNLSATPRPSRLAIAIPGCIGGVVGGLLGGGSGVFYVPALERLTGWPRVMCHGTAGAANIAVTGVGAATFALVGGSIAWLAGSGLVLGGMMGAALGVRFILLVPEWVLRWIFIVILMMTVLKLCLDAIGLDPLHGQALLPSPWLDQATFVVPVATVLGVLIGAWAAALGLGGGLLAVPALMLLFGTNLPTAEGTSLLMFFPNAVVGTMAHVRQGTADTRLAWGLNLGALPGAALGAMLALALDSKLLGLFFAAFALAIAVRELREALSS